MGKSGSGRTPRVTCPMSACAGTMQPSGALVLACELREYGGRSLRSLPLTRIGHRGRRQTEPRCGSGVPACEPGDEARRGIEVGKLAGVIASHGCIPFMIERSMRVGSVLNGRRAARKIGSGGRKEVTNGPLKAGPEPPYTSVVPARDKREFLGLPEERRHRGTWQATGDATEPGGSALPLTVMPPDGKRKGFSARRSHSSRCAKLTAAMHALRVAHYRSCSSGVWKAKAGKGS